MRLRPGASAALAVCLTAFCFSPIVSAQTSDVLSDRRFDTVVVTGTRTATRIDQSLAEVSVIDRAQIEQASGRTLAELLGQQSGVQFSANGGAGKSSAVYLRGLEARHTLLLIDGVRYGSATLGTPAWENIPLDSIERIEIVRGPLSGLYGSDAVGGVIQIFTRLGLPGLRPQASVSAGTHRSGHLSGGLQFGQGAFDGALQLARNTTQGFSATNPRVPFGNFNPDDDGFRQTSGSARLGWRFAEAWRADLSSLASKGETQIDDGPAADARAGLRTQVIGLQVRGPVRPGWTTAVRVSRSKDEYETLSSASVFGTLGTIATVQQQLGWENTVDTPLGSALLLAETLRQTVSRPGAPFAVSERSIDGVAAGLNGRAGVHTWQGNLRHDRNSQFGGQTTGSLGYGHDLTPAWRAGASYGTSFVAPSFNQLYFPGFGNPNLLPEEGRHAELSLRWAGTAQQLRMAYVDNRIRGYISSGPAPTNIPRTRIDGYTLSYDAQWAAWTVAASLDRLDPRNDTAGTANFGRQLPRRSKDSLKLAADTVLGSWRVGATAAAFGERYDDAANTRRVGGFATLDLYADWRLAREWTLSLKLNNAGGKVYETVYGYNQPGREGRVTLRYSGM
jgi:vitamin B12 transporter